MDEQEYMSGLGKKYSSIERRFATGNVIKSFDDPIKLSPDNTAKKKFKSTINKTRKFFKKIRLTFGNKTNQKRR